MILFASDLHLCSTRPEGKRTFLDFLAGPARRAETLYILGDLFDYWVGDDDLADPFHAEITAALRRCAESVPISFMRGNRDFLVGSKFETSAGVRLTTDPLLIDHHGATLLLTHGDALCTHDSDYMAFREEVRSPAWIATFLQTPLPERRRRAEALRAQSESEKRHKSADVMDVSSEAVEALLREYGYPHLIHGHTHRPARHVHEIDGRRCDRWVLADWYACGSFLRCDAAGIAFVSL